MGTDDVPIKSPRKMGVIGRFPDGMAAMAMAKYGDGHLSMIAPHPGITPVIAAILREGTMGAHARRWGWSKEQIEEAQSALDK